MKLGEKIGKDHTDDHVYRLSARVRIKDLGFSHLRVMWKARLWVCIFEGGSG
jgi:hypothetical protein